MTDLPEDGVPSTPPPVRRLRLMASPVQALAAELDEAPVVASPEGSAPPSPDDLDDGAEPAAPRGGGPGRPWGEIWQDCPVRPLGVRGRVQYIMDIHGQVRAETKIDAGTISTLFGNRSHLLFDRYPVYAKGARRPTPKRFDSQRAMLDIVAACADRGLFDPIGMQRGVGAWTDDDGALIYHCGDQVYVAGEARAPGPIGGRIYEASPAIPHPAASVSGAGPAAAIRDELGTWCWRRGDLDVLAATGVICAMILGGALDWRPACWVTGGAGTGKSRLQSLITALMGGDRGVVRAEDATGASLANTLRISTLPVQLDELEAKDAGSAKERQIIELMRLSSSGGRRTRSAADQSTTETIIRATFVASSILIPALEPQDRSRIVILDLDAFPAGTPKPAPVRAATWQPRGHALKRLLIDRWPSWPARLEAWHLVLGEVGVGGRRSDNWATLLALAETAESPDPWPAELRASWARRVADETLGDVEAISSDADEVLVHLLSQPLEAYTRGEHYTVAQWVMVAARLPGAPASLINDFGADDAGQERRAEAANAKLARAAIKVVRDKGGKGGEPRLFVGSNRKVAGLARLFEGSPWAGGAWGQSLARVKGALSGRNAVSRTLAGIPVRGVEIPLAAIPGLTAFPQDREPASAPASASYPAEDFI